MSTEIMVDKYKMSNINTQYKKVNNSITYYIIYG